jgi:uncharacterized phage protein gp47/JayE
MNEQWGLSDAGFLRPEYEDILADYEIKAVEIFGSDINLSSRSPLGMFVRVFAMIASVVWQLIEKVYNAGYVDTATGTSLSRLGKYIGISRLTASKSYGEVTFTGDAGTVIPQGFLVSTVNNTRFLVQNRGAIPSGGSITLPVSSESVGTDSNVSAGSITVAVTPILGLTSLSNANSMVGGRYTETDEEFRDRYQTATSTGNGSSADAIRSELLKLVGVSAAKVFENDGNEEDGNGLPPHSINAVVQGGDNSGIASTIHRQKSAGIATYGSVSVDITDASGAVRSIQFSRPSELSVWIKVSNLSASVSGDGLTELQSEISNAIIHYVGGVDSAGTTAQGLTIGESLLVSRLFSVLNGIEGVLNYSLSTSVNGTTYTQSDINPSISQVVRTSVNKVVFE